MKILLLLLTILFAVWLWRRNRLNALNDRKSKSTQTDSSANNPASEPSPMQACSHCGVHMPTAEMVQGQRGIYCSLAHSQAAADNRV